MTPQEYKALPNEQKKAFWDSLKGNREAYAALGPEWRGWKIAASRQGWWEKRSPRVRRARRAGALSGLIGRHANQLAAFLAEELTDAQVALLLQALPQVQDARRQVRRQKIEAQLSALNEQAKRLQDALQQVQ